MFESYVDYNQTFRPLAKQKADEYVTKIRKDYPSEHYGEPMGEPGHSGPGTGGLTAKLFWDYYDFTRDKTVLKNVVYPLLEGMSCFLSKTVVKEGRGVSGLSIGISGTMYRRHFPQLLPDKRMYV